MNGTLFNEYVGKCNETSKNVGIFIDFDNIYYGLRDYGADPQQDQYCIFSLMEQIYSSEKIRTMRAYADYDQVKISFMHLQKKRVQIKNVYGNGLDEDRRKNASDIELSLDALEVCHHNPEIDTFVFITSDSDMIPIMNRLMFKGKKIHLFCIDANTSHYQDIFRFCHIGCDLLALFEIDSFRKSPEFWEQKAIQEIHDWYGKRRHDDMMLGGKWMNQLFCDKFNISYQSSSRLISHLKEKGMIYEASSSAGHTGFLADPQLAGKSPSQLA